MDNTKEYLWYTGDWKNTNSRQVPYNGVMIRASANYGLPTSPPSARKLVSVDLEVVDYTYNTEGVSSKVELDKTNLWYDIPIPEITESSPTEPNSEFTVKDIYNTGLGKLKLDANTTGIFLNIQFRYGVMHQTREELGYIMKIHGTFNENENSIDVSG